MNTRSRTHWTGIPTSNEVTLMVAGRKPQAKQKKLKLYVAMAGILILGLASTRNTNVSEHRRLMFGWFSSSTNAGSAQATKRQPCTESSGILDYGRKVYAAVKESLYESIFGPSEEANERVVATVAELSSLEACRNKRESYIVEVENLDDNESSVVATVAKLPSLEACRNKRESYIVGVENLDNERSSKNMQDNLEIRIDSEPDHPFEEDNKMLELQGDIDQISTTIAGKEPALRDTLSVVWIIHKLGTVCASLAYVRDHNILTASFSDLVFDFTDAFSCIMSKDETRFVEVKYEAISDSSCESDDTPSNCGGSLYFRDPKEDVPDADVQKRTGFFPWMVSKTKPESRDDKSWFVVWIPKKGPLDTKLAEASAVLSLD